jgi:hypothetical protein
MDQDRPAVLGDPLGKGRGCCTYGKPASSPNWPACSLSAPRAAGTAGPYSLFRLENRGAQVALACIR